MPRAEGAVREPHSPLKELERRVRAEASKRGDTIQEHPSSTPAAPRFYITPAGPGRGAWSMTLDEAAERYKLQS